MSREVLTKNTVMINASSDTLINGLRDVWQYRELAFFLSLRSIKIRYQQTILGVTWAIIQPLTTMVVFTIFFGGLAQIPSDGIPYPVFSYTALVPWTMFAAGINQTANSLVGNSNLIRKVYFPRLVIPISTTLSVIIDFLLSFSVLIVLIVVFYLFQSTTYTSPLAAVTPLDLPVFAQNTIQITSNVVFLPFFFLLALSTSLGVGLWFSALNVQFRDVRYTLPFIVQLWLFITPIAYPSSLIDEPFRTIYGINPMTGVVEGFRWALLGVDTSPGAMLIASTTVSLIILSSGYWYFKRVENNFADIV